MSHIIKYRWLILLLFTKNCFAQNSSNNKLLIISKTQKAVYDSIRQLLVHVDETDQQYRNNMDEVREKYGGNSAQMESLVKDMRSADSLNLITVESIINKYGWLGADKIGDQANTTLFMVIQHNNKKTQEKYLPVLKQAVKNGNAKARYLALMEDRVNLEEGKYQVYGSQLLWNIQTNAFAFMPIKDPDNLDRRRAAVGLSSYADYLKDFGLTWNLQQYKINLPEIERRFKLKKPGY